ncbi:hypothetical protein [Streptomyces sp. 3N207]
METRQRPSLTDLGNQGRAIAQLFPALADDLDQQAVPNQLAVVVAGRE